MFVIEKAPQISSLINKAGRAMIVFFLLLTLQGCPYATHCFIDTNPQNQVNENYLGKWQGELVDENGLKKTIKLDINKIDDYYYEFLFHGFFFPKPKAKKNIFGFFKKKKKEYQTVEDTIRCSAYASYVMEREVLNIEVQGINYLAEISLKDNNLTLLPISEKFSSKVILSDFELREAMEFHFKSRLFPSYDEAFCLRNMRRQNEP